MNDPDVPREGRCLCGQVRFRVSAPPLITAACHCTGCQRLTASAFSLTAAIPSDGFAVTQGEPVIGALHGPHRHYFCPHCLSWLFTRVAGMDGFVNVRPTMLDEPGDWTTPFIETMTSERLPWASTPAVRSFEKYPATDEFEGLLKGYAERALARSAPFTS